MAHRPVQFPIRLSVRTFSSRLLRALPLLVVLFAAAAALHAQTAVVGGDWVSQSPSTSPSARYYGSMTYDPQTETIVLFGGYDQSYNLMGDTWIWSGGAWTQMTPSNSPSPRYGASMAYDVDSGNVILFGGHDQNGDEADTWMWDGANWSQQTPSDSPPVRNSASLVSDPVTGTTVLFGGFHGGTALGDTWTWNGYDWTQQSPASSPSARENAMVAYDPNTFNVVLFGGFDPSTANALNDTWTWDGSTWTQQSPVTSPSVRFASGMDYDPALGKVLLAGGSNGPSDYNDSWVWSNGNWSQIAPPDTFSPRLGAGMAYDPADGYMLLFGGSRSGGSFVNDTWTYIGGSFTAPATLVGTTAASTSVYFTITSDGTLPASSSNSVLTQGQTGGEFQLGPGSTCAGAVTAGTTCTVNVLFKPSAPGIRSGAVNLLDSSSNVLATAFISGLGLGPQRTLSPGVLTTFAGSYNSCSSAPCGDGGPATSAQFGTPIGFAIDSAGNSYIADVAMGVIRKVSATTGTITTVAGSYTPCATSTDPCGDGGPATDPSAQLNSPFGIAVDGAGNIYIADSADNRIRKVSAATGVITTIAGTGDLCSNPASCGDGGPATSAFLNDPIGVAVDGAGNVYIADSGDSLIREVSAATGNITTVAGMNGELYFPTSIALDNYGDIYIADYALNLIVAYTPIYGEVIPIIGNGSTCSAPTDPCGDGDYAYNASFNGPFTVALDAAGDVYITDSGDNRIRKASPTTDLVTTVAGTGESCTASVCGDGGSALGSGAQIDAPTGIAIDNAGNMYVSAGFMAANQADERVRKISATAAISFPTTTTAGTPDTTDGTQTVMLNNIGNLPLDIASMANNSVASFSLANPLSGGCSTSVEVDSADSCLLGEQFSPVAGAPSVVVGSLAITDNSLNAPSAVQFVPLTGTTAAGGLSLTVGNLVAPAGTSSLLTLAVSVGYGGALPTGTVSFTIDGSSSNIGTATCKSKASHLNCTALTDASSLAPGPHTITASITADGTYSAASANGALAITGAGSGAHTSPVLLSAPPQTTTGARILPRTSQPAVISSPTSGAPLAVVVPVAVPAQTSDTSSDNDSTCAKDSTQTNTACPAASSPKQPQ